MPLPCVVRPSRRQTEEKQQQAAARQHLRGAGYYNLDIFPTFPYPKTVEK